MFFFPNRSGNKPINVNIPRYLGLVLDPNGYKFEQRQLGDWQHFVDQFIGFVLHSQVHAGLKRSSRRPCLDDSSGLAERSRFAGA
jgi:hypothetical protein